MQDCIARESQHTLSQGANRRQIVAFACGVLVRYWYVLVLARIWLHKSCWETSAICSESHIKDLPLLPFDLLQRKIKKSTSCSLLSANHVSLLFLGSVSAGQCENTVVLKGDNINVAYNPDATHIAVGNSVRQLVSWWEIHHSFCCDLQQREWRWP